VRGALEDRFFSKVQKTETCWIWTAYKNKKGYGQINSDGYNMKKAHRVSYEMHNGNIPDGLIVCHSCDNPSCVNPQHLWLGTDLQNAQDRDTKGRCRSGISKKQQTHCIRGHEFSKENTRVRANGTRNCRTCHAERSR
jgi:hypothetical protein